MLEGEVMGCVPGCIGWPWFVWRMLAERRKGRLSARCPRCDHRWTL